MHNSFCDVCALFSVLYLYSALFDCAGFYDGMKYNLNSINTVDKHLNMKWLKVNKQETEIKYIKRSCISSSSSSNSRQPSYLCDFPSRRLNQINYCLVCHESVLADVSARNAIIDQNLMEKKIQGKCKISFRVP